MGLTTLQFCCGAGAVTASGSRKLAQYGGDGGGGGGGASAGGASAGGGSGGSNNHPSNNYNNYNNNQNFHPNNNQNNGNHFTPQDRHSASSDPIYKQLTRQCSAKAMLLQAHARPSDTFQLS